MEQGDVVISGFGYYQERAEVDGFRYFTTSLKAGDQYPDSHSRFLKGVAGYMLLNFRGDGSYALELKDLEGRVIDVSKGRHSKE